MVLSLGFVSEDIIKENRITEKEIVNLQEWLKENSYTTLTDSQAVQFILSCDNDVELAKKTVVEHFKSRMSYPELFDGRNLDGEDFLAITKTVHFNVIPQRTKDGSQVLVYKLVDPNYRNYNLTSSIKVLLMTLDAAIYDYPPTGLLFIVDFEKFSFMHLTKMNLRTISMIIHYLQEGLPVKLKAIHIINVSYAAVKFLQMAYPLMRENLKKMVFAHSKPMNFDNFQETHVEKDCLPNDYGGTLQSVEELQTKTIEKLRSLAHYFEAEKLQREQIGLALAK